MFADWVKLLIELKDGMIFMKELSCINIKTSCENKLLWREEKFNDYIRLKEIPSNRDFELERKNELKAHKLPLGNFKVVHLKSNISREAPWIAVSCWTPLMGWVGCFTHWLVYWNEKKRSKYADGLRSVELVLSWADWKFNRTVILDWFFGFLREAAWLPILQEFSPKYSDSHYMDNISRPHDS